ncbi:DUF4371 domain-containing protein [Trichonephila clavipes]|nr:DUF4371 domain-containing protein [Trichonephila clavipes]
MLVWLTRKENKSVLDKQLQEQLRKDTEYYHNVLKRVIAVVKYLAIIGLAFSGTEEVFASPHIGNFMDVLEPLDEFDPFICELIEQSEVTRSTEKGHPKIIQRTRYGVFGDVHHKIFFGPPREIVNVLDKRNSECWPCESARNVEMAD